MSGALSVRAAGVVTVAGAISAAGAGDAIVLSGSQVRQQCRCIGTVGDERSLAGLVEQCESVWRRVARPSQRIGLRFKQYAATYGVTPVAQATGNGFLYSLAPSVTPGLTGATTKVYDGTTAATLLSGNFTAAGAVDGDTVTLNSTGSNYADRNVGAGKAVTATGIGATASNAGAPVYGYTLASTTATANIGVITPAALTVTAQADNRVYNGTTASSVAPVLSGTTYDAVGTAATQTFDNRNVGVGKTLTASGLVMADGNGGANYAVNYVNNTTGVITPASADGDRPGRQPRLQRNHLVKRCSGADRHDLRCGRNRGHAELRQPQRRRRQDAHRERPGHGRRQRRRQLRRQLRQQHRGRHHSSVC